MRCPGTVTQPAELPARSGIAIHQAAAAGKALRAGRVAMTGTAPNGHAFVVNPQQIWLIPKSSARLGDQPLGPPSPLGQQARLGDFWIPQRGVFVIGRA
jgi:hypothetical protein